MYIISFPFHFRFAGCAARRNLPQWRSVPPMQVLKLLTSSSQFELFMYLYEYIYIFIWIYVVYSLFVLPVVNELLAHFESQIALRGCGWPRARRQTHITTSSNLSFSLSLSLSHSALRPALNLSQNSQKYPAESTHSRFKHENKSESSSTHLAFACQIEQNKW